MLVMRFLFTMFCWHIPEFDMPFQEFIVDTEYSVALKHHDFLKSSFDLMN